MIVDKTDQTSSAPTTKHFSSFDEASELLREFKEVEDELKMLQDRSRIFKARLDSLDTKVSILFRDKSGINEWKKASRNNFLGKLKAPEVIVHFLKQQDSPISLRSLRNQIIHEGYPPKKFGKNGVYFYVAIDRLKNRKKIEKEGDEVRLMG